MGTEPTMAQSGSEGRGEGLLGCLGCLATVRPPMMPLPTESG